MCRLLEKWRAACVSEFRTKQQTSQDTSATFRFWEGASAGWAPCTTSWPPGHVWPPPPWSGFSVGNRLLPCPLFTGLGWQNPVICGALLGTEPRPPLFAVKLSTREKPLAASQYHLTTTASKTKLKSSKDKNSTWPAENRTLFLYIF